MPISEAGGGANRWHPSGMALPPTDWPEHYRPLSERSLASVMHDTNVALGLLRRLNTLPDTLEREHHLYAVGSPC